MVESIPAGGPVLDSSYILTCIAGTPSINGSVSLRWKYPDGAPVLSGGHLLVEEVISVGNGSHVSLTLSKVLGEATYICYGSMELYEYPDHTIESTLTETVVAPGQYCLSFAQCFVSGCLVILNEFLTIIFLFGCL